MKKGSLLFIVGIFSVSCARQGLPELPPMPEVGVPLVVNSVIMDSHETFSEVQLDIPIAEGPFEANWESIEKNYSGTPQWLRDAKFGIWVHFGPQSAGESGDRNVPKCRTWHRATIVVYRNSSFLLTPS